MDVVSPKCYSLEIREIPNRLACTCDPEVIEDHRGDLSSSKKSVFILRGRLLLQRIRDLRIERLKIGKVISQNEFGVLPQVFH